MCQKSIWSKKARNEVNANSESLQISVNGSGF